MSTQIPTTMKAVVEDQAASWVTIRDIPVPEPGDNEVLVKVAYAAQNPSDWKLAAFMALEGTTQGGDFSGTVVKIGKNLKVNLEVGDEIAGSVLGGSSGHTGSFAEYAIVESDLAFKVPKEISLEDASTFGVAWGTAGQIVYHAQKHSLPPSAPIENAPWYIIYGGSTSVGLFAIQLIKLLGYKVLTFASPHSFDLVKSYGADAVLNYKDSDVIQQALKITNGGAKFGFDTISEGDSFKIAIGALGEKGERLNVINFIPDEVKEINPKVELDHTFFHTLLGKELNFSPRTPETPMIIPQIPGNYNFGKVFFQKTTEFISKFGIRANPVEIRKGLESIAQGLKDQQEGKVSGKKIVYKIAE